MKDIERLFTDRCTVYVSENSEKDGITVQNERVLYKDIKCRISFKSGNYKEIQVKESINSPAQASRIIKLFVLPEYKIPTGSRIEVTRNSEVFVYANSGAEAVYDSHREIILELFEKWS